MKQGTVSVLVGCHSPIHSLLVWYAWRKVYGKWPTFREIVCIFLHDIGHWGMDYLDHYHLKQQHWWLGASAAYVLFDLEAFKLVAGHCETSGAPRSTLYKPDKHSWYLAPTWWLYWNNIVEPKLMVNCKSNMEAVRKFQATVRESILLGKYESTHGMYLARKYGGAE
jgi:hypothetical protein